MAVEVDVAGSMKVYCSSRRCVVSTTSSQHANVVYPSVAEGVLAAVAIEWLRVRGEELTLFQEVHGKGTTY